MTREKYQFEEVELRDYIRVLRRHKYLILGILLIFILITSMVSFFALKPIYQSTSRILVDPQAVNRIPQSKSLKDFLNFETLNPVVYSPQTYVELLKNPFLEEKVIETVNLQDEQGRKFSPKGLEKISSLQVVRETGLIEIKVEYRNAELARDIANTWAQLFIEQNKQMDSVSERILESKLESAQQQLSKVEKKKKEFDERNKIDLLKKEIDQKLSRLILDKTRISELEQLVAMKQARIKELEEQLQREKRIIVLTESIAEHPLLNQLTSEITGKALSNLEFKCEHINPVYEEIKKQFINSNVNLATDREELSQRKKEVKNFTTQIAELRKELTPEELTARRINREFQLAENIYIILSRQSKETKIAGPWRAEHVKIASLSRVAEKPIRPKKKQNIAIAGIMGLLIGIIAAFGVESRSKNKDEDHESK